MSESEPRPGNTPTSDDRVRAAYRGYREGDRARLWDRANPGYARLADDRDRALRSLIASSLPAVGSAEFLDVGCGDGTLVATVADAFPAASATGLDLLEDRLMAARLRAPGAAFVGGSATALPFPDRSFDVAAAITLFSSIPDPDAEAIAAREIGRVLKPGGWLVWYDLRYDNPGNREVHGISAARLRTLFPGWHAEVRSTTLIPPIARRLGPLTAVAYPLLEALPPLRSHLIGRLRCPG